ncbi:hypothetical protein DFQ09_10245 [Winogradskyella pacifica]|uniref:DUF3592 domain-containing protein n=1 Tax=Winogradskyella pacifica TaxID=664642 RepID=A0A3D9N152_9FLAO|nr:hypothetical protein [Winogradskyella pacifica]REE25456.1 hypothetical protein DFQ09_10245 [Winogradskyella pacifica]
MRRLLLVLGIIIISLEIVLYTYWYKVLEFMEFFVALGLCHLANSAIILGLLTELLPKDKRKLKHNIVLGVAMTFFLILFFNASRVRNRIDKDGILTHGIIIKKKYGAKTSPYVITKFNYKGTNYKSTLTIPDSTTFEKINLGDSVVIKFVKEYPKMMNRTVSLLN